MKIENSIKNVYTFLNKIFYQKIFLFTIKDFSMLRNTNQSHLWKGLVQFFIKKP